MQAVGAEPRANGAGRTGSLALGAALGAWLLAADAWLKTAARLGTCDGDGTWPSPWSSAQGCGVIEMFAGLRIEPQSSSVLFGVTLADALARQLAALALLACVTVLAIAIGRGRWRTASDTLALGCAFGGARAIAAPILLAHGSVLSELRWGGLHFGLGEIAVLYAAVWLVVDRLRGRA